VGGEHTGKPGFPRPLPGGAPAAPTTGWEIGKPGFPNPLPGGRVWEGCALPRTNIFILVSCGAAAWMTEVNIARPREGLGGLRPPKNNNIFILALCGAAA